MNLTSYKRRRLRQKPNILTIEQSRELGQLAGIRSTKNVTDKGLIPINLFRLRKRKLEAIYHYLLNHQLIHDKEPAIESLQTHQLAEYLLNTIYPGYPACKAKNLAYTDYRECREKEPGQLSPLAYDYVPTTEVYDRLDEVYRIDFDWQEKLYTSTSSIDIPISALKKSMDRILRISHNDKPTEGIEYHLCFWNSTLTLLKPQCKSLRLNSKEIWSDKKQKMVAEGFMHIDITKELKSFISPSQKWSNHQPSTTDSRSTDDLNGNTNVQQVYQQSVKEVTSISKSENRVSPPKANQKHVPIAIPISKPENTTNTQASTSNEASPKTSVRKIRLDLELFDNDEYNISHISISAVRKKLLNELVCELYLQATTECIDRAIRKSLFPLDTQQIVIHLLKQYHQTDDGPEQKLRNAETVFMICLSNTLFSDSSDIRTTTSSEEEFDEDELHDTVTLIDSVSHQRIQHPIKSLHCRHRTCFDAASFFSQHADIKLWHCPICRVHIKSFEELRMDYTTKVALNQYPHEDRLYVFGEDTLLSEAELFGEAGCIMDGLDTNSLVIHIEQDTHQQANSNSKSSRQRDQSEKEEQEERNHVQKRYRAITHVM